MELNDINLPKWPAMVVHGKSVTKEQAAEIIFRTNEWSLTCNLKDWVHTVYKIAGVPYHKGEWSEFELDYTDDTYEDWMHSMGVLQLQYLFNCQIMSSYVGGAQGWCQWDGRIVTANYNIGKYPCVEEVLEEWRQIAAAFPYLDLWCQLFSGETCEDENMPLVEFVVKDGKVTAQLPTERDYAAVAESIQSAVGFNIFGCKPRGCTAQQLFEATQAVKDRQFKAMLRGDTDLEEEKGCTVEQLQQAVNLVRQNTI